MPIGATADDAAELSAVMRTDEVPAEMAYEAHQAVVTAAAEVTAEAIMDAPAVVAAHAEKPPARLSQERKEKLEALGFVWSLRSKRIEDHWDLMFRSVSFSWAVHSSSNKLFLIDV